MIAFAANSVLTRMAIDGNHIDASGFALVRVLSGAIVLGHDYVFARGEPASVATQSIAGSNKSCSLYDRFLARLYDT